MIQEACAALDSITDRQLQLRVIETIRVVSEGKIYVEAERARVTYRLALMYESEGKIDEAAAALLELQVGVSQFPLSVHASTQSACY